MEVIWATDFFTYEILSVFGPVTFYVLIFIHLKTRQVKLGGITHSPNETWMTQIARNITDAVDPFLPNAKYLIMDGDKIFTKKFKNYLKIFGIKPKVITRQSPDLNAFAERFVLSIKSDYEARTAKKRERSEPKGQGHGCPQQCLNHMILWNWQSLNYVVSDYEVRMAKKRERSEPKGQGHGCPQQYIDFYNNERPHQGIDNLIPIRNKNNTTGKIKRKFRLGGLLNYYYREAA